MGAVNEGAKVAALRDDQAVVMFLRCLCLGFEDIGWIFVAPDHYGKKCTRSSVSFGALSRIFTLLVCIFTSMSRRYFPKGIFRVYSDFNYHSDGLI